MEITSQQGLTESYNNKAAVYVTKWLSPLTRKPE